jgi:hypothetical protein
VGEGEEGEGEDLVDNRGFLSSAEVSGGAVAKADQNHRIYNTETGRLTDIWL